MADPWQCPACKTWLAPQVTEHRCKPDEGTAAQPAPVTIWPGTGGGTVTATWPYGEIITTNTGYSSSAAGLSMAIDPRLVAAAAFPKAA